MNADDLRAKAQHALASAEDALWAVQQAQAFVQQIDQRFMTASN